MRATALAHTALLLLLSLLSQPALAGCSICVESVGTERPGGGTVWRIGEPLTLVVIVSRVARDLQFPAEGVALVREGEVRLRKFSEFGDTAAYAGNFTPDREGLHRGRVRFGDAEDEVGFEVRGPATVEREQVLEQLEPPLLALAAAALAAAILSARRRRSG